MTTYVSTTYSNPWNPLNGVTKSIDELNANLDKMQYWANPLNWFKEIHRGLNWLVNQPETATYLMAGTIVGIMLIMLGANFPKKWLFWGWITYWVLRGVIYRH